MKDSNPYRFKSAVLVVNCFQKLLSSWWRTANFLLRNSFITLWIAFKNYYLRDEGQLLNTDAKFVTCCELLSKIIIFVMKDSYYRNQAIPNAVVNCFQKLLSSWWRTADYSWRYPFSRLWIAFKNYYLRDEGQHRWMTCIINFCCELLSKIIIFVMKDSRQFREWFRGGVVNCFQKLLSSWWRTAIVLFLSKPSLLWIAFKNYYLRDEGQRKSSFVG